MITGIQKIKLSGSEKRVFSRRAQLNAQGAEYQYAPMILKINSVISVVIAITAANAAAIVLAFLFVFFIVITPFRV